MPESSVIPEILGRVSTPLALAALLLILGAGVLHAVLRKRTTVGSKMVIRYGFALAVILSLSANATYVANGQLAGADLLSGSVRGPDNENIGGALIDVVGIARGMTLDDGTFQIAIPRALRPDSVDVVVTRRGYTAMEHRIAPVKGRPLRVTLERRSFDFASDVILTSDVSISHLVGLPDVHVPLRFRNPTATPISIEGLRLTLRSPAGRVVDLWPSYMYDGPGRPYVPPLTTISVEPGAELAKIFTFGRDNASLQDITPRVNQALNQDGAFGQIGPRIGRTVLSEELASELRTIARSNQIWTPGPWVAEVRASVGGVAGQQALAFTITDAQLEGMESVYGYYRYGFALAYGYHMNPIGEAVPAFRVSADRVEPRAR